ncbi:MAG TPA: 23S rRNA (guanosine(2251)-2'-O)-methyltransferase RlmB [Permianibacter sp.]|nr:23S rRNA (guanosine(2251)-2'-O)-methyltransferase RlmB [Permianibacter sp.]
MERIFGVHAVSSLLEAAPERIIRLYVLDGRDDHKLQALLRRAEALDVSISRRDRKALDQLTDGAVHQGVVAECKPAPQLREDDLETLLDRLDAPLLLVLDGITDPHNLGACLRTADAAGVHAVIAPKDRSAALNPTVRKVACGAAERVPFITVTNLARTLRLLKDRNVWVVGTAGEASDSIYQTKLSGPLALVMGAEGEGMRRLTREHCDQLVHIPMFGTVSSLNVSVATGVCLFEAVRQRSPRG